MKPKKINPYNISLRKLVKYSALIVCFLLSLSEPILASESFENREAEEDIYKRGLTYRDEEKYVEAIPCFAPLAEKDNIKAQHNLAFCYYKLGKEEEAYNWYKYASDQGFKPSGNNLKKMNLLYLLVPNELLNHTVSFLRLEDLSAFKFVSQKAYQIFKSTITRTNFLNSENPYAVDFRNSVLSQVSFDPQPHAIKLVLSAKSKSGSIEVHFRDTEHLRNIVEETPKIDSKKNYFVHNPSVEDSKELLAIAGDLEKEFFLHVMADTGIKVSGQMNISCPIVFPVKSDSTKLTYHGKLISFSNLVAFQNAHDLANVIETFDQYLYKIRTNDAYLLLEERKSSRLRFPDLFPDLSVLAPEFYLLSKSEIEIVQKDYISAAQPFIYIANSVSALKELQVNLPEFSKSICYIDPRCSQSGVYCSGPLYFQRI